MSRRTKQPLSQVQGINPYLAHQKHPNLTRRELLARGFLRGSSLVFAPSLLDVFANRAMAQGGCAVDQSATAPVEALRVLAIEAAGGMGLAGSNFVVWGQGGRGDHLNARALGLLGLPANMAGVELVSDELGIPMHANSPLLEGIKAVTTPECRALVNGFPLCVSSMDDSNANPFSVAYWAYKAGAMGSLAHLIGSESSAHGARSPAPAESLLSSVAATTIRNFDDARGLVSATNLEDALPGKVGDILAASSAMSESRLAMFNAKQMPEQVRELVRCGYIKARDGVRSGLADAVDASQNTALLQAIAATSTNPNPRNFAVNRDPNDGDNQETLSLAYLLLNGYAGFASKTIGGCDYHNNPRANTNQVDFDIGVQVGLALQSAHTLGKALVIVLQTDGAVGCSNPDAIENDDPLTPAGAQPMYTSDRGEGSAMVMLAYHPSLRPVVEPRQQVNAFNQDGGVDQNYLPGKIIANSVTNAIQCIVMNLLALGDKLGSLDQVLGANHPFRDPSAIENYVMFRPWRS